MDIYDLIVSDHKKAKQDIAVIKALPSQKFAERIKLFRLLKDELISHNDAEEESFYVALLQNDTTNSDAKKSAEEHHEAALLLEELDGGDLSPTDWGAKFEVLCEALMKHITKEEGKIFKEAKSVLSETLAKELATEMSQLKLEKQILLRKTG